MTAPILQANALTCGYREPVVPALTLELHAGEALAVVGPNGAGKTTLLRTLCGALAPLAGQVLVQGQELHRMRHGERARRVAILLQHDGGDGELTVEELVQLGRTPHLGPWGRLGAEDREAVAGALKACQLTHLAERRLDQVSGGELQRARIALTVAQQAPLLLLDEPVNHLDLRRRHEFFTLLSDLRQNCQLATVLVLHDLTDAFTEAGRVLILSANGPQEIAAQDPRREQLLAQAFEVPLERIPPLGGR